MMVGANHPAHGKQKAAGDTADGFLGIEPMCLVPQPQFRRVLEKIRELRLAA
jgi:hypothetical protein